MKLLELYEPLFQHLCRLQRASRLAVHTDFNRVRSDLLELLARVERDAAIEVRFANQVRRLELPILFFIDNLICTSRLPFAMKWFENRLAAERGEQAGDERFFEFLEADLNDRSEEAAERLAVYQVCLGLGFTGVYLGQPERLRGYLDHIFPRVRQWMDTDPITKITEEAYRHTNKEALTESPSNAILVMTLIFVGVVVSGLVTYRHLYLQATEALKTHVGQVMQSGASDPGRAGDSSR